MAKKTIKTKWDLSCFYNSLGDKRIERDVGRIGTLFQGFEKKYKNKQSYLKNEAALLKTLQDYEKLKQKTESINPIYYLFYVLSLNSADSKAEALLTKYTNKLQQESNRILFFELRLGTIPKRQQKKFLASKKLRHYHYFLKRVFVEGQYRLTEKEEKILNLKSLPAYSMWKQGRQKLLDKQTVRHKSRDIPLSQGMELLSSLNTTQRRSLHTKLMQTLRESSDFAESEINAIYTDKKINDELRGFDKPYQSRILADHVDEKGLLALRDSVTKHFGLAHRFHRIKQRLLGFSHLTYSDRLASIGKVKKKFTFNESYTILHDAFLQVDTMYAEILEEMANQGRVDVFPKKGKRGGAFCSHSIGNPTFVLLNHVDNFRSLTDFAHEMGHAIHSTLSKSQSALYEGYSTAVAEVASTFFENLAFDAVFENLSKQEQIIALHDRIAESVATIFRQIAVFNFEFELHERIRSEGSASKEDMAALMNKHVQAYLGPAFKLTEDDGYFFVWWSHIRNFFYVYTYAYGELVSNTLYERYKQDREYSAKIKTFLSVGGSDTPVNIFKNIGVDVTHKTFFEEGIRGIEKDIDTLERLTRK